MLYNHEHETVILPLFRALLAWRYRSLQCCWKMKYKSEAVILRLLRGNTNFSHTHKINEQLPCVDLFHVLLLLLLICACVQNNVCVYDILMIECVHVLMNVCVTPIDSLCVYTLTHIVHTYVSCGLYNDIESQTYTENVQIDEFLQIYNSNTKHSERLEILSNFRFANI